jgi:hypothetical protein
VRCIEEVFIDVYFDSVNGMIYKARLNCFYHLRLWFFLGFRQDLLGV